jgi:hypothetical protein
MKMKLRENIYFKKKTSIQGPGLGVPMWEQHPQIEDAVQAPPYTAVTTPLPTTIWDAPVESS